QTYTTNLSNVIDYLNKVIKQRRRRSSHLPPVTEQEKKLMKAPANFSLTGSSLVQLPNESERAYKFRIETEIEELQRLLAVIQGMVLIHIQLVDSLRSGWKPDLGTFLVADAMAAFVSSLQTPYTTYAVVALSGVQKSHLALASRSEVEKSEFVNRIVNKYVASTLNAQDSEEPTEMDWQWYLKRPIFRLSSYPRYLSAIHGDIKIKLSPAIDADNKRLRIASIKFECIAGSITEALKK
ncbi:hypothetical protein HDU91_002509, partial [Kappamyces sp. JEL0680]